MKIGDLLNTKDLKATLQQAGKTAAGTALTKVLAKDQVRSLIAQQTEQQAITTAGEQAFNFWQKHRQKIIFGGIALGTVTVLGIGYLILKARKK